MKQLRINVKHVEKEYNIYVAFKGKKLPAQGNNKKIIIKSWQQPVTDYAVQF